MNPLSDAFTPTGLTVMFVDYVVAALWMGLAIVALTALLLRVWKPLDAAARYAVWYAALIAIAIAPVATAIVQGLRAQFFMIVRIDDRVQAHPVVATAPRPFLTGLHHVPLPEVIAFAAIAVWIALVAIGIARIVAGAIQLARLKRDALPLSPALRDGLSLWRARAGRGAARARLCVSDRVEVPVAVGLFDRMVVVPDRIVGAFDLADIDRFILHELAHLDRRDDWTALLQRIVQTLQFFNPAVHVIARQLDLEREIACDDRVVDATHDVRTYAVGLTRMAESTAWPHRALAAPAIFVSRKQLSLRVEQLLGRRGLTSPRTVLAPAIVAFVVAAGLVSVASPLSPSFSLSGAHATPPDAVRERFLVVGKPGLSTSDKGHTYLYVRRDLSVTGAAAGDDVLTAAQVGAILQSFSDPHGSPHPAITLRDPSGAIQRVLRDLGTPPAKR